MNHADVKELFFEACLLAPRSRSDFLDHACGSGNPLRSEVESLLTFHEGRSETAELRLGAPAAAPAPRLERGQIVCDRFTVERRIGCGSSGEVYAVIDRVLGTRVALKMVSSTDDRRRQRLYAEVRLARRITHPGICRVYDVGDHEGTPFLTMELIAGEDLAERLAREGAMASRDVARLGAGLADALAAAHAAGVLHRDLKPANVLVDRDGAVHVTDFGIASVRNACGDEAETSPTRAATPLYEAPELQRADAIPTERCDLYSLGVLLYELLTGAPPFDAPDRTALREMHRVTLPEAPSRLIPGADRRLEAVILALLAKDPAARPFSAAAVAAALREPPRASGHAESWSRAARRPSSRNSSDVLVANKCMMRATMPVHPV